MIACRQYSSAAENIATAHAIRQQLLRPRNAVGEKPKLRLVEISKPMKERPSWCSMSLRFDAHVKEYYNRMGSPVKSFIADRCVEYGIDFAEVLGPSRKRSIVYYRHRLVYEVWREFQKSIFELAIIFNRDHSSLFSALRKYGVKTVVKPKKSIADHSDEVLQLRAEGLSEQRIADHLGFNQTTVHRFLARHQMASRVSSISCPR